MSTNSLIVVAVFVAVVALAALETWMELATRQQPCVTSTSSNGKSVLLGKWEP
jgi:hypothetical protein